MKRPEFESPPPATTEHQELLAVREKLMEMDRALRAERIARNQLAARSSAEITHLRRELKHTADSLPSRPEEAVAAKGGLILSLAAVVAVACLAGFSIWYVDPLHTWDNHQSAAPPAAQQPAKPGAVKSSAAVASPETHAFSRLNEAVRSVPSVAMPSVLNAANDYLDSTGKQACSVESRQGEVSLVISGHGDDKPLLAALSRCAQAVEHLTQASQ